MSFLRRLYLRFRQLYAWANDFQKRGLLGIPGGSRQRRVSIRPLQHQVVECDEQQRFRAETGTVFRPGKRDNERLEVGWLAVRGGFSVLGVHLVPAGTELGEVLGDFWGPLRFEATLGMLSGRGSFRGTFTVWTVGIYQWLFQGLDLAVRLF